MAQFCSDQVRQENIPEGINARWIGMKLLTLPLPVFSFINTEFSSRLVVSEKTHGWETVSRESCLCEDNQSSSDLKPPTELEF